MAGQRRKYTREVLAPMVAESTSVSEVIRKLGQRPSGGMHRLISNRIREAGVDTSHFPKPLRLRVQEIDDVALREQVHRSLSIAQVCQYFGLPDEGRAHKELKRRIERDSIDVSHHRGAGWARGETAATHPSLASMVRKNRVPDAKVFVENSPITKGPDACEAATREGLGVSLQALRYL